MLDFEYTEALGTVIFAENISDEVRHLRLSGVNQLKNIADRYTREGMVEKPVAEMWRHKIPFVLTAVSKTEMENILNPSEPRYNYRTFSPKSPYHSEAEELMLWSMTSLRGPLIPEAATRYMELFAKYFPNEASAIM